MLFKPVYLKAKMRDIPETMERYVPAPEPLQIQEPEPQPVVEPDPEPELEPEPEPEPEPHEPARLPILVCCSGGSQVVYPIEARRDVLAGKVSYLYIDDKGAQVFKPKHIFAALKLEKESRRKYEDYSCIGEYPKAMEDELPRRSRNVNSNTTVYNSNEESRNRIMSPFSRGSYRPRA